jgi:dynein heavy chain
LAKSYVKPKHSIFQKANSFAKLTILPFHTANSLDKLNYSLAESEQMRREADDIGPTAELAYWKSRMAKFNK